MTGPTVRSGATLDLTVRADRPVVGVPVLPGPAGPVGPTGPQGPPGNPTQYDLRGTGFPEGTVTAPVGTSYTDTAATNGAIRWIKATGTGATGWRVLWGDTGIRTVTGLLINGWTANQVFIRRSNDFVAMALNGLNPAAATADDFLADLGIGWRGSLGQPVMPIAANGTPTVMARFLVAHSGAANTFRITNRSAPAGQSYTNQYVWHTADAWPATLP